MSFTCHFLTADEVHLTINFVTCPFTLIRMKKINAKSRNHLSSATLFLPVESKRIEIVSLEIHHRINLVHNPFSHPALWVLINGKESIPSTGGVTRSITVFTYRAGTNFHPRFHSFYTFIYITYNFGDIIPAPLIQCASFIVSSEIIFIRKKRSILRITQIVEMHSVYIITANDFPHQFHQVLLRCRMSRVEEIFALVRNAYFFHPLGDRLTAERSNMLLIP